MSQDESHVRPVLLEDPGEESDAVRVAQRIIEEMQIPFTLDGNRLHTSISVGLAFSLAPTGDLLHAADAARRFLEKGWSATRRIPNT